MLNLQTKVFFQESTNLHNRGHVAYYDKYDTKNGQMGFPSSLLITEQNWLLSTLISFINWEKTFLNMWIDNGFWESHSNVKR